MGRRWAQPHAGVFKPEQRRNPIAGGLDLGHERDAADLSAFFAFGRFVTVLGLFLCWAFAPEKFPFIADHAGGQGAHPLLAFVALHKSQCAPRSGTSGRSGVGHGQ